MRRLCAIRLLSTAALLALPALLQPVLAQQAAEVLQREGQLIPTGGTLNFGDAAERRLAPTPKPLVRRAKIERDWIDDVVDFVLGPEPKPRRVARLPRVSPSPMLPLASASPASIVTGALPVPSSIEISTVHQGDADASLVREAERAQARVDLVKLELARRAYDEANLGGQAVFASRPEWRVLERARDAWTDAELSASKAAAAFPPSSAPAR